MVNLIVSCQFVLLLCLAAEMYGRHLAFDEDNYEIDGLERNVRSASHRHHRSKGSKVKLAKKTASSSESSESDSSSSPKERVLRLKNKSHKKKRRNRKSKGRRGRIMQSIPPIEEPQIKQRSFVRILTQKVELDKKSMIAKGQPLPVSKSDNGTEDIFLSDMPYGRFAQLENGDMIHRPFTAKENEYIMLPRSGGKRHMTWDQIAAEHPELVEEEEEVVEEVVTNPPIPDSSMTVQSVTLPPISQQITFAPQTTNSSVAVQTVTLPPIVQQITFAPAVRSEPIATNTTLKPATTTHKNGTHIHTGRRFKGIKSSKSKGESVTESYSSSSSSSEEEPVEKVTKKPKKPIKKKPAKKTPKKTANAPRKSIKLLSILI